MDDSNLTPIKVDVKLDSKDAANVLNKLIETIKAPFAYLAKHKEPIKRAKAETEAALIRARSIGPIAEALGLSKEDAASLILHADQREQYDKIRQQKNIESIVQGSIEFLPSTVKDEPVEEDWTTEFFEQCKNVSDEKMQFLWSRILAGEIAEPGSYSKRTLSFIKTLSQSEAEIFTKFCSLLWFDSNSGFMHIKLSHKIKLEDFDIHYIDLMELESLGLIRFDDATVWYFEAPDPVALFYFDELLFLYPKKQKGRIQFNILPLTKLGNTLARISGAKNNDKYRSAILDKFTNEGLFISELPPRIIKRK